MVFEEPEAEPCLPSRIGLLSRSAMYESGYVEWDVDMVFEEPEAEPCLPSRSSPHRAVHLALGSGQPAASALANRGAGVDASARAACHGTGHLRKRKLGSPRALQPSHQSSLAAIAPTVPEPSIDTAQFRARALDSREPQAADGHARADGRPQATPPVTVGCCGPPQAVQE
jgi:hypothetical protein